MIKHSHIPNQHKLTSLQSSLYCVLLTHYRAQPNSPGLSVADLADLTNKTVAGCRTALQPMETKLAATRNPFSLIATKQRHPGIVHYRLEPRKIAPVPANPAPLAPLPSFSQA